MEARNLTEENVTDASKLFDDMKKNNPELKYNFFKQGREVDMNKLDLIEESIENLANNIDEIKRKLDQVFGNHILINGQFKDIKI